jgi:hypothetical protein
MVEFSALDSEITTKLSVDTKNQSYSRKKTSGKQHEIQHDQFSFTKLLNVKTKQNGLINNAKC